MGGGVFHVMKSIDFLEHGGGHFHVRHRGELIALADPRTKHYQWVLTALYLRHVPGSPEDIPDWKRAQIFDRWRVAWDLPEFNDARRLAYLVDHYRAPLANDLAIYAQIDLGALWRERRWVRLLDVIDRLPAHGWYSASVSNDEEHAKMMAESVAARKRDGQDKESAGPSMIGWTPEVSVMTNVLDAVRGVQHAVFAAQHGKKAGEPPKPSPRPITALERALKRSDFNHRKAKHEALVKRLLPNKGKPQPPTPPPAPEPTPPPKPKGPSPADVARVLGRKRPPEGQVH